MLLSRLQDDPTRRSSVHFQLLIYTHRRWNQWQRREAETDMPKTMFPINENTVQ